ncbi:zinc finger CCCH domain-containing protein 39-like isoform X1 [Rhododendron vialii]|uniref:zinc finger CCCH domain-containing protein 39-like isoform X1 n=1 Tax=Rhododendron vialii TaxID=182163 RepID=UPI00265EAA42|nr:zinc finger CCCH domain-containing protein 39-like isoform X1 [Rhododendron vialii]
MDPNLTTLNPVTTNQIAHAHFHPTLESGGNAVNFSPQFLTCDEQYANASNAEYPSFKKPRTSQTPVNSRIPVLFNKPNMGIPFKNVPCLQFSRGHCTYGDNCQYSHGIVDTTQKILPQREELMSNETWNEDQIIISSMKLCWRFCNGEQCPFGMRCHFRHEVPAKFRKNFATSTGSNGSGGFSRIESEQLECKALVKQSLDAIEVSQKPVYWKTRLCNKWGATGNCPYGISCGFAHGHAELKKVRSRTAMEFGNVSTSNMTPTAVLHASSTTTGNGTSCEKKMQGKKCLLKWKAFEKISHIYADWIDDMPLVHTSLGKVGS